MTLTSGAGAPTSQLNGALDLVVVGGAGHVGLPLALSFAEAGVRVGIYNLDEAKIARIATGNMPFLENGAEDLLGRILPSGALEMSTDAEILRRTDTVILVIGTPIDEFMNPSMRVFEHSVDQLGPLLKAGALIVLRSTVYPGTTDYVASRLHELGVDVDVVCCPERIAEGHALEEIRSLPQLIGASSDRGFERASSVFAHLGMEIVRTQPREAELAKLLTNTWRYMKFAIANQFFQIAHADGLDYDRILHAIRHNYPRAQDLPAPGFAAGPCLLKDTMQLAAFASDHFPMGHAAMTVNEGLPGYIVESLERRRPLHGRRVGVLGMAFKGESDDPRTSLSYKLKKLLACRGALVMTTDPYVEDPDLVPLNEVLAQCDLLIVAAPHKSYRNLDLSGREVADVWGVTGSGIHL
ncbi:MAG: nucleotide sugar dehydrogenase [Candidatus Dormibacteraceae bacterium]